MPSYANFYTGHFLYAFVVFLSFYVKVKSPFSLSILAFKSQKCVNKKKKKNNNSAVAIFSFPPEVKLHGWSRREFCSLKTKGPVFCKGVRDTSGTLFPTGGECSRLTVWRSRQEQ